MKTKLTFEQFCKNITKLGCADIDCDDCPLADKSGDMLPEYELLCDTLYAPTSKWLENIRKTINEHA